MNVVVIS